MQYIYIDEAGRGPLAGPVYVGIVVEEVAKKKILHANTAKFPARKSALYKRCDDSKILNEIQRDSIYEELTQNTQFHGNTAKVSAKDIDRHGIVWALRQGVLRAMHAFFVGGKFSATGLQTRISSQQYEVCLIIDGPHDFGLRKALGIEVVPVIDGDALIPMVGAASILAKVERDTYMKRIAKRYSTYGFEKHKGYGTKAHYAAIKRYGMCDEHRKTYIH